MRANSSIYNKTRIFIISCLILLLFALCGCLKTPSYTVGQWFALKPETILKGKTTKSKILSDLGRPTLHLTEPGQNETLVYAYSTGEEEKLDVGLLVISFDANELVKDYYVGYNYSQVSTKETKENAKADYISESSVQIIKDLLNSKEANQKISAVLLSFEGFRPGLLGFMKTYLEKHVDAESDLTVKAVYLLALDGIEDNKHAKDTPSSIKLLALLKAHPDILPALEKSNVIAMSALTDFVKQKAGQCNRNAVALIYRNILDRKFKDYYISDAKNLFTDKTECVLETLKSFDRSDLESVIQLLEFRKDLENKAYLKLQYYKSVSDATYGKICEDVLQVIGK